MSKINLTYKKEEYTLSYDRQTIKMMEGQGFVLEDVTNKPATMIPLLFDGAFYKYHRGMKRAVRDEIFDELRDKTGLIQALMEMYAETLSTIVDSDGKEGNVSWAKVD